MKRDNFEGTNCISIEIEGTIKLRGDCIENCFGKVFPNNREILSNLDL